MRSKLNIGLFVWHDLFVENARSAMSFYSELLGWESNCRTIKRRAVFSMSFLGENIASIIEIKSDISIKNRWMPYILVDNLDQCMARASEQGGHMPMQSICAQSFGRFGVIIDPLGSPISLVEKKEKRDSSARILGAENVFCWHDIVTKHPEQTREFYQEVFGWTAVPSQTKKPFRYWILEADGARIAGIRTAPSPALNSFWNCYLSVSCLSETIDKCCSLGGSVISEITTLPKVGKSAVLSDHNGGAFSALEASSHLRSGKKKEESYRPHISQENNVDS